jgi:hypothetical protein
VIPSSLVQEARNAIERLMVDSVEIDHQTFTADAQSNRIPGPTTTTDYKGRLQHMTEGETQVVADRLQSKVGYKLYLPHTVSPDLKGQMRVNGDGYEILAGMRSGELAGYTKYLLRRIV